jgi:Fe-S-cluster containining protein
MDINLKEIESAFYSDGFKLGMKVCEAGFEPDTLYAAVAEMYSSVDGFIDILTGFASQQEQPVHCKKGCEWCCHQPVFAMTYELDFLNYFIENNFDEKKKSELKKRAEDKKSAFGFLTETKLLNSKHPCPLLEDGACSAYAARPMACRIYLSSDVNSCLRFYKKPADNNNIPNLLNLPLRAGRMMNEGFKAALKNHGFVAKEYRIEEKLLEKD